MFGPLNASTFSGPFSCRQREGWQCTPAEGVTRRVCSGSGLVGGAAGRDTCRRCPPSASPYRTKVEKSRAEPCPQHKTPIDCAVPRWRPGTADRREVTRETFFGRRTGVPAQGAGRALVNGAALASPPSASIANAAPPLTCRGLPALTCSRYVLAMAAPTPSPPTPTSSFASVVDAARERAHIASPGSPPNTARKSR